MKDNEIIEALNCCQDAIIIRYLRHVDTEPMDIHIREIAHLLDRQQEEIKKLRADNERLQTQEILTIKMPNDEETKRILEQAKNAPFILCSCDSMIEKVEVIHDNGIGSLEFYCNDLGKNITIHDYLIELLKTLWGEQDEFSGKRPFGNGGWDYDLIGCLIANHIIEGKLDEDGYVIEGDTKKGYALIQEYIESLSGGKK